MRNALLLCGLITLSPSVALGETVNVPAPAPYSYESSSVRQLKVRGSYGRYITFIGRTSNSWQGTDGYYNPGNPGYVSCTGYGGWTTCRRIGYVPPSYTPGTSGGAENRYFRYDLDCVDGTFDRKGDRLQGIRMRGWLSVTEDPVALMVARRYCPSIHSLPYYSD